MQKCDVWGLVKLIGHIDDDLCSVKKWVESEDRDEIMSADALELYVTGNIFSAIGIAQKLGLESTYDRVEPGHGCFYLISSHLTWQQAYSQLDFLREAIEADLEKLFFVQLTPTQKALLDKIKQNWALLSG